MWNWYENAIIAPGRQPVFVAFVAFIVTLVATRIIVRLIRAGKGPFGNVSAGDVHIHHVIPGIVLMGLGGLMGLSASRVGPLSLLAGLMFGAGAALVLDEFPLILHLDDVYWQNEGRLSVEATTLAMVVMGLAVLVTAPYSDVLPDEYETPTYQAIGAVVFTVVWVVPVVITALKGKIYTAALALIMAWVAWIAMFRLAKPRSPWAMRFYRDKPAKMAKAQLRSERTLRRVQPLKDFWARHVFGFGSPSPAPAAPTPAAIASDDPQVSP